MPFEHSQGFLNLIGSLVRDGRTFLHGTTTRDLTDGAYVAFVTVTDNAGLTAVEQIYGSVKALQMIWPDSRGKMPWDHGYKNGPLAQPFLGPLPDHWDAHDGSPPSQTTD